MQRARLLALLALPLSFAVALACQTNEPPARFVAALHGDLTAGVVHRTPFADALDEACGDDGDPTALGYKLLERRPYLQDLRGDSAAVLWTSSDTRSDVELRRADDKAPARLVAAGPDPDAGDARIPQQLARLEGLEPGAIYCYRVVGADGPWTEWIGFRPAPARGDAVQLVVVGDLGEATTSQLGLLEQIKDVPVQAVLVPGDVAYVHGTIPQFESNFFGVYQDVLGKLPWFPVAGNHDYHTDGGRPFRQVFSLPDTGGKDGRDRWYSFDFGDVHIVAVHTEALTDPAEAHLADAQRAWLEADLAASDARWKLVFLHEPPFSSGDHGDNETIKRDLVPIFERYGVDLVLAGHDHSYERFNPINGVPYIVTGGGGRNTKPVGRSEHTAFSHDVIHFTHLDIQGDKLVARAIDGAGDVFDTMTVVKESADGSVVRPAQR